MAHVIQPEDEFPDVITRLKDGESVDWELKEWLEQAQMREGIERERLDTAIEVAIPVGPNTTKNVRCCMLWPREGVRFEPRDAPGFTAELSALITEVDARWPQERAWQGPQGYTERAFERYPTLGKYLTAVYFDPRVVAGEWREWFGEQPWIVLRAWGGAYDPDQVVRALVALAREKLAGYGSFGGRDTRLLIFYNRGVRFNTPFHGLAFRSFVDLVPVVADEIRRLVVPFSRVYLLNAPEREAYQAYPTVERCG